MGERKVKSMEKNRRSRKIPVFLSGWIAPAIIKGMVSGGMVAWLFFRSVAGCVVIPVAIGVFAVKERKVALQKATHKEQQLFAEFLGFLKEALQVGYSLEQAVGEAKKGMLTTGEREDDFLQALTRMQRKMQLGTPVEEAFSLWAEEAKCEDIRDFSEVLFLAKRTGGAVQHVIGNTERIIRDKQDTMRYIQSVLHSREYEAKIMKLMPFAMLFYLQVFMPGFLDPLYHNTAGICMMSVTLAVYLVLCYLADRATKITL